MVSSPEALVAVESSSIRRTTLETIRVGSLLVVLSLAAVGLRAREHGSTLSDLVLGLAVALALFGALARRPLPWLSLAGIAGAVVSTSLVVENHWRADASTAVFVLGYFGVVLLPRRRALAWIVVPLVLWVAVAPSAGIEVSLFGTSVNLRWLTLSQLVVSTLMLWAVWERELDGAAARDALTIERERDRLDALQVQERLRAWRRMLVHTHETVLNDIRYVLSSDSPDAGRLAEQLRSRVREMTPAAPRETVSSVAAMVAASEGLDRVQTSGDDARLGRRQAEAFTAVLREVVRNAQRHASASAVHLRCAGLPDGTAVEIRYDRGGPDASASPGIGRAVVIGGSLESIGGHANEVPGGVDLFIPSNTSEQSESHIGMTNVGRVVLSAVTVGNTIGGVLFPVALLVGFPGVKAVGVLLASLVATIGGAVALQRRSLGGVGIVAVTVASSLAALLASQVSDSCEWAEVVVIVATLSGYSLCSALVWATRARWWLCGLVWVASMLVVFESLPEGCVGTTSASFRAAALPVAFFVVITFGLRSSGRAARLRMEIERGRVAELAEASAAEAASQVLHDSVQEATTIMSRLVGGGGLDGSDRERLGCLDAMIRAAVQVDPGRSGAISLAAKELVEWSAANGVPVRVLTVRDSGDRSPIAPEFLDVLRVSLPQRNEGTAAIQVLTGPDEDLLVVTTTGAATKRAGLTSSFTRVEGSDELSFEADEGDDGEVAVLFLRRSVSVPDATTER